MQEQLPAWMLAWNGSACSPPSWQGVSCFGGRVVALSFSNLQMSGKSHPVMFRCRYIYAEATCSGLSAYKANECNDFLQFLLCLAGPLPDLARLQHLQNFSAAHNQLTGAFPVSLPTSYGRVDSGLSCWHSCLHHCSHYRARFSPVQARSQQHGQIFPV